MRDFHFSCSKGSVGVRFDATFKDDPEVANMAAFVEKSTRAVLNSTAAQFTPYVRIICECFFYPARVPQAYGGCPLAAGALMAKYVSGGCMALSLAAPVREAQFTLISAS